MTLALASRYDARMRFRMLVSMLNVGGHWSVAVLGLASFASAITFYVSLCILALRLSRSVRVWCGLTILTGPIGILVAYFAMKRAVEEALASLTQSG